MKSLNDVALSYDDLLLVPQFSTVKSRSSVNLSGEIGKYKTKIPIIASSMDTISESSMAIAMNNHGGLAIIHRFNSAKAQCKEVEKAVMGGVEHISAAVGVTGDYLTRTKDLYSLGVRIICVDIAHGDHILMRSALQTLRQKFPDLFLIAGAVAMPEGFEHLAGWGANAIRVGIGGGSICETRLATGHGVPIAQSIIDCDRFRKERGRKGILIIADGGCTTAGDIVKALALGADYVLLGSLLAGTLECPGEIVDNGNGNLTKRYRGMASNSSQKKNNKGRTYSVEGVEVQVPYKGSVRYVLDNLVQNIKSGLSYSGASNLEEFRAKADFIRQSPLGMKETGTHIYNVIK